MRAKSDIISGLSDKLTSDIWKKLKNGLLGRELIALGGEIISESENVKDALLLQLNPDTADTSGLYMLAQMNEVPITGKKPSSVVVNTNGNASTYAPFELEYSVGNQSFYNIEYTLPNQKGVSLWCGTPKNNTSYSPQTQHIYDGGMSYECKNIGNAYPDSITVKLTSGVEVQRYSSDIALSDNIPLMYKVITGNDGTQNIRFIVGEGGTMPQDDEYTIEWLDHNVGAIDYDDSKKDVKVGNTTVATVQFVSEGSDDDIDFMRKQLKKEMAKYDGLNTPKSVERYVNSMPYVVDSKCAFDEKGVICVYIKPALDENNQTNLGIYLDFPEIAAHISLNSILFPNIKVVTGNKLLFGITISGIKEQAIRDYAGRLIRSKYAYDKIGFGDNVNISEITTDIYGKYGIAPTVRMTLKEPFVGDEQLSYIPERNSVSGFDDNGKMTMVEKDGVLYSISTTIDIMNLFDIVCCVGTMVLFKKERNYIDYGGSQEAVKKYMQYIQSGYGYVGGFQEYTPISNGYAKLDDFYIWDSSTNTIKAFDTCIDFLLSKADNSWFTDKKETWKNIPYIYNDDTLEPQTLYIENTSDTKKEYKGFLSMQDVKVFSTNNGIVLGFVMCDNGETRGLTSGDSGTLKNNLYNLYHCSDVTVGSPAAQKEHNQEYNGCYQLTFCVSNNIFRNILSESWGVRDIFYGLDTNTDGGLVGYYDGFKGYNTFTGEFLDIKANSFYFEDTLYYLKEINNDNVKLCNNVNTNVITIPTVSDFKGMIEQNGVLYVVQKNNVSVVEGFSGIKQQIKTYSIYKDDSLFPVDDIVVGLGGTIMIKASDGFYVSRKITVRDSVAVTFDNIQKLFTDMDGNENFDVSALCIGSSTAEYATCYKKVRNTPSKTADGDTAQSTMDFYCYDISKNETHSYHCVCNTKSYYSQGDAGATPPQNGYGYERIESVDTDMGGTMQEMGVMNYDDSKIEINGTADLSSITTIKYNGVASNNKVDSYIVLDENEIKFV